MTLLGLPEAAQCPAAHVLGFCCCRQWSAAARRESWLLRKERTPNKGGVKAAAEAKDERGDRCVGSSKLHSSRQSRDKNLEKGESTAFYSGVEQRETTNAEDRKSVV